MPPLMTRLTQDHARLARLLDLFSDLLDRFHEGAEPDYDLMHEMLEYMEGYADCIHHPTEDLIFQRVLDQGKGRNEVMEILMRQHKALIQLGKQFRESLDGILHGEVLLREDVEAHGRALVGNMRGHMVMEDKDAFPIALQSLSEADWAAIEAAAPTGEDPVFGTPDPLRFRALYRYLSQQAHS